MIDREKECKGIKEEDGDSPSEREGEKLKDGYRMKERDTNSRTKSLIEGAVGATTNDE